MDSKDASDVTVSNVWPPPPSGAPEKPVEEANTSGQHGGVPSQIAAFKWNWGAFFLSWLWCVSHRMVALGLTLLVLDLSARVMSGSLSGIGTGLTLVSFLISCYLGWQGHTLGWRWRHFSGGVEQFLLVQRAWLRAGLIITIVMTVIVCASLVPAFLNAYNAARSR